MASAATAVIGFTEHCIFEFVKQTPVMTLEMTTRAHLIHDEIIELAGEKQLFHLSLHEWQEPV